MQWDDSEHAGFTTGTPWIAVHPNHTEINAAAQVEDPHSVFAHFRAVIALRHDEPAVAHGDFTMLLPQDERVYAFERGWEGTRLLVVANLSSQDRVPAPVPEAGEWTAAELVLGTGPVPEAAPGEIVLGAWDARVYRRR
jgi:oligo-1,6-glucosidase